MAAVLRLMLITALVSLTACGGGGGGSGVSTSGGTGVVGGGSSATSGTSGSGRYADAESLVPFITAATVPDDGRVLVDFQLTDGDGVAIVDLTAADIRLTIAKLGFSSIGNLRGDWQSYINDIELPGIGPGLEQRLQAEYEAGTSGTLGNNGDGTYQYRFAASITSITDQDIVDQAAAEGLDLSYQSDLTHRVAMEFRNAAVPSNTSFDWIPQTGVSQIDGIFHYDVAARDLPQPRHHGCQQRQQCQHARDGAQDSPWRRSAVCAGGNALCVLRFPGSTGRLLERPLPQRHPQLRAMSWRQCHRWGDH
jgi:hypothetical protein